MVFEFLDWTKCTVHELKQACKDRGLEKTGKKVELIARLKQYYEKESQPDKDVPIKLKEGRASLDKQADTSDDVTAGDAQEAFHDIQSNDPQTSDIDAQTADTGTTNTETSASDTHTPDGEGDEAGGESVDQVKQDTAEQVMGMTATDTPALMVKTEIDPQVKETGNPDNDDYAARRSNVYEEEMGCVEQSMDTEDNSVTDGVRSESGAQTDGEEEAEDDQGGGSYSLKPKFWRGKFLIWHTPYSTEKFKRRLERENVKLIDIHPMKNMYQNLDWESEVLLYPVNFDDFANEDLRDIMNKCSKVLLTAYPLRKSGGDVEFKSVLNLQFKKRSDIAACLPVLSALREDITVHHQSLEQVNTTESYPAFCRDVLGAEENSANATLYAALPENVSQDDLWGVFPMADNIIINTNPQRSVYVYFINKAMLNKNLNWLDNQHVDRRLKKLHFCLLSELLKPTVSAEEFLAMKPKRKMSTEQSSEPTTAQSVKATKSPLLKTPSQKVFEGPSQGSLQQKRPLLSTPPPQHLNSGTSFGNQFSNLGFPSYQGSGDGMNNPGVQELLALATVLQQNMGMTMNNQQPNNPNQQAGGYGRNLDNPNQQLLDMIGLIAGQQGFISPSYQSGGNSSGMINPSVNDILMQLMALQNSIGRNPSTSDGERIAQQYGGGGGIPNVNELLDRLVALQNSIGGGNNMNSGNPTQRYGGSTNDGGGVHMNHHNQQGAGGLNIGNPNQMISQVLHALEAQQSGQMPRDDCGNGQMITELRKLLSLVSVNPSIQQGIDNLCHSLSKMGYEDQAQNLHAWSQQQGPDAHTEQNTQFSPKRTLSPGTFDNSKRMRQNPGLTHRPSGLLGDAPGDRHNYQEGQKERPRGLLGNTPQNQQGGSQGLLGNAPLKPGGSSQGLLGNAPQGHLSGQQGLLGNSPQDHATGPQMLAGNAPQGYRGGFKGLQDKMLQGHLSGAPGLLGNGPCPQGLLGNAPNDYSRARLQGGAGGLRSRPQGLLGDTPHEQLRSTGYHHGGPGGTGVSSSDPRGSQGTNQQEIMTSLSMLLSATQSLQKMCGGSNNSSDSGSWNNGTQSGQAKQKRKH